MANHRAEGRAQVRPLTAAGKGARRSSKTVSASAVKVGMLGALATATIAAPLASATADQGAAAAPAPASNTAARVDVAAAAPAATTLALPSAQGTVQYTDAVATGSLKATAPVVRVADGAAADVDEEEAHESKSGSSDAATSSAAGTDGWFKPTPGAPVTSSFGYRTHPTLGYRKMHNGVDFGASCGTPVHAAESGTVIAAEYHPASGQRVKIKHSNGLITDYYHLSSFAVSTGDTVAKGQKVGSVGSTGRSTGCHLHFGLEQGEGSYLNPMSLWQ